MTHKKNDKSVLSNLRQDIDQIDSKILSLIYQRQDLVKKVAEWKSDNGLPILDNSRELEKIANLSQETLPEDFPKIKKIFATIMDFSKHLQARPTKSNIDLNLAIVGMGLMGGSLFKAINKYHPHVSIYCTDTQPDQNWPLATNDQILQSQIILLCMPPNQIIEWLEQNGRRLSEATTVIDIASTKKQIFDFVNSHESFKFNYIPAHPIVGKEISGFDNSETDLFLNKEMILCKPLKDTPQEVLQLFKGIGLNCKYLSVNKHDKVFSDLSHLPHLIALALILSSNDSLKQKVIPSSFKDLTRIAKASGSLWLQIYLTNKENVNLSMNRFLDTLKLITNEPDKLIEKYIQANKLIKENMNDHSYGKVPHRKSAA